MSELLIQYLIAYNWNLNCRWYSNTSHIYYTDIHWNDLRNPNIDWLETTLTYLVT